MRQISPAPALLLVVAALATAAAVSSQPTHLGDRVVLRSEILDELRTLYVRLPASYRFSQRRYPVLYLLDAEWHFPFVASQVSYLSECGASDIIAPEMIVVGLENVDRNRDFTPTAVPEYRGMEFPTSGGAARLQRFFKEELIPFVDRSYRTTSHRVLGGWSFGGLFAIHSLMHSAGAFNAYLAISPSLWWDDELLVETPGPEETDPPARLVLTIGSEETGGWTHSAVTRFAERLRERPSAGLKLTFIEIDGAGHNQSVPLAYYRAVRALYSDWLAPDEVVAAGEDPVVRYYQELSVKYGYDVPIPADILIRMGLAHAKAGRLKAARETLERAASQYPEMSMAHYHLGRIRQQSGDLEAAEAAYRRAIDEELRQVPPDGLDLQLFQRQLAEVAAAADRP